MPAQRAAKTRTASEGCRANAIPPSRLARHGRMRASRSPPSSQTRGQGRRRHGAMPSRAELVGHGLGGRRVGFDQLGEGVKAVDAGEGGRQSVGESGSTTASAEIGAARLALTRWMGMASTRCA